MARVADVRKLGGEFPASRRIPVPSRSKAGRQSANKNGIPNHPQTIHMAPAASNTMQTPSFGTFSRPVSRGTGTMYSSKKSIPSYGPVIKFAPPSNWKEPEDEEEQEPEEDLMDILQKRIEEQKHVLRQQRESMQTTINQDVAFLNQAVENDRRELTDVHYRYRQALDELARLRGEFSALMNSKQEADAAAEEARADAAAVRSQSDAAEDNLKAEVDRLSHAVKDLQGVEEREAALLCNLKSVEAALSTAKQDAQALPEMALRVTELSEKSSALQESIAQANEVSALARENLERKIGRFKENEEVLKLAVERKELERANAVRSERIALDFLEKESAALAEQREVVRTECEAVKRDRVDLDRKAAAADKALSDAHSEADMLRAELAHREAAIQFALDQVKAAEEAAAASHERLHAEQERTCKLSEELHGATAEVDSLKAEINQLQADGEIMATTISTLERSVERTESTRLDGKITTEKRTSSYCLPEGGESAKGIAVMINYTTKETIIPLQTTIKEKERIIQQVTTQLRSKTSELEQAKVYWKASQKEASNSQLQARTASAERKKAQDELTRTSEVLTATTEREKKRADAAEERCVSIREQLSELTSLHELLKSEYNAQASQVQRLQALLDQMNSQEAARDAVLKELREAKREVDEECLALKEKLEDQRKLNELERSSLQKASNEHIAQARRVREDVEQRLARTQEDLQASRKALATERMTSADMKQEMERKLQREKDLVDGRANEKARSLSEKRERQLSSMERHFKSTVAKLLSTEQSMESSLTCMVCLRIMSNPVVQVCGHSCCSSCVSSKGCQECEDGSAWTEKVVVSQALDAVCGKYAVRVQELASLQKTLAAA